MVLHRYKVSVKQIRGRKKVLEAESDLPLAWYCKALEVKLEELKEI